MSSQNYYQPIPKYLLPDDKEELARLIKQNFKEGNREVCLMYLFKCYQIDPYYIEIVPYVWYFKKEIRLMSFVKSRRKQ